MSEPSGAGVVRSRVGRGSQLELAHAPGPLATWVRWRLHPTGSSGPWDVTFRVLVTANRVTSARMG